VWAIKKEHGNFKQEHDEQMIKEQVLPELEE